MSDPEQRPGPIVDVLIGAAACSVLIALLQQQLVVGNTAFLLTAILAAVAGPITRCAPPWSAFGFLVPGLAVTLLTPWAHLVVWLWVLLAILFGISAWSARLLVRRLQGA